MNEFEKQMLAMMHTMQADMAEMKGEISRIRAAIVQKNDSLEGKIDKIECMVNALSGRMDKRYEEFLTEAEKVNAIEAVVSGLVFDVAVLKRKVG